jgi:hypothetical protein
LKPLPMTGSARDVGRRGRPVHPEEAEDVPRRIRDRDECLETLSLSLGGGLSDDGVHVRRGERGTPGGAQRSRRLGGEEKRESRTEGACESLLEANRTLRAAAEPSVGSQECLACIGASCGEVKRFSRDPLWEMKRSRSPTLLG